jgi:hypothetical protein
MVSFEMLTDAEPLLTSLTYPLALWPTVTEPNATVEFGALNPETTVAFPDLKAAAPQPQIARPQLSIATIAIHRGATKRLRK